MKEKSWEKSPQALIDTFYFVMESFPDAELRKMFGYPCAFLNGNMFVGLHEGNMALRMSEKDREKMLDSNLGRVFAPMPNRIMKEYVALSNEVINDTNNLLKLLKKSYEFVNALPVKVKKPKAPPKAR